jgi:2-(1,2-epoxy-1,2-dihydrophenyl)acetyl-CoA isomerase
MKNDLAYHDYIDALRRDERRLVRVDRPADGVAVVIMDDPENMNALGGTLTVQLRDTLEASLRDPSVRAVVLTGSDPAFSVGGDWKLMTGRAHTYTERDEGTTGLWQWIRYQFGGIARLITQSDTPVIAALNGAAAGVALAWALNCDLILASDRARLVTAFGRIGLVPEVGTNWLLTRRLGYAKAFELFVRGNVLSAAEARDLGLVNEVLPHDDLMPAALKWGERVARLPLHVVSMTKPLMRNAADMSWHQAILAEEFAEPNTFTTRSHQDAVRALVAKEAKAIRE